MSGCCFAKKDRRNFIPKPISEEAENILKFNNLMFKIRDILSKNDFFDWSETKNSLSVKFIGCVAKKYSKNLVLSSLYDFIWRLEKVVTVINSYSFRENSKAYRVFMEGKTNTKSIILAALRYRNNVVIKGSEKIDLVVGEA